MSNESLHPESNSPYDYKLVEPLAYPEGVVVPLYPTSFLDDSEKFNYLVSEKYTKLEKRERARRIAFLKECIYIDYPLDINLPDSDYIAYQKSEAAWARRQYTFDDESFFDGAELRIVDEMFAGTIEKHTGLTASIAEDEDHCSDTEQKREEFQKKLREQYVLEAAIYKQELEDLAYLREARGEENINIDIQTNEMLLGYAVLQELKEIFLLSDEHQAILEAERERIAKEERKAKLAEIFRFLRSGLEEDN